MVVVRDSDGVVVFTAALKPSGTPQRTIDLDANPDPNYDKAFPSGDLDPATVYNPTVLDESGHEIGIWEAAFRPSDLQPGMADGGFTHDRRHVGSKPMSKWKSKVDAELDC